MRTSISEILLSCSKQTTTKDKIAVLQQNDCVPLRVVLSYALDPRVKWLLPAGVPPYKPTDHLDQQGNLYRNIRKINLFVEGGDHPNMHTIKRETLFIQFLEGLDPDDAKLICSIKDKRIPYKGITANLVNSAFPGLIPEKE
jgi:hypothetical protein